MTLKNEAQLRKFLMEKCAKAVDSAKTKVHNEFASNLDRFYTEYSPEEYIRTYALYNSLESTDVKRYGNQHGSYATAEVFFSTPSYEQGLMPLRNTPIHGKYGWSSLTGEEVLDITLTSSKPHGGYIGGTPIWKETMKNLGGKAGIKNLIKQELKKQGL